MMKSIEIAALSFVIESWRGISRKNSRRSTTVPLSTNGIKTTRPGPFVANSRPSRNTTMRWYSGMIRIALNRTRITKMTASPTMMSAMLMQGYLLPRPAPAARPVRARR